LTSIPASMTITKTAAVSVLVLNVCQLNAMRNELRPVSDPRGLVIIIGLNDHFFTGLIDLVLTHSVKQHKQTTQYRQRNKAQPGRHTCINLQLKSSKGHCIVGCMSNNIQPDITGTIIHPTQDEAKSHPA